MDNNCLSVTMNPESVGKTNTYETGVSDHKLVDASIYVKQRKHPPKIIEARPYMNKDDLKKTERTLLGQ